MAGDVGAEGHLDEPIDGAERAALERQGSDLEGVEHGLIVLEAGQVAEDFGAVRRRPGGRLLAESDSVQAAQRQFAAGPHLQ